MSGLPAGCRKKLRLLFKKHLAIAYGESSASIEARLRAAVCKAYHKFSLEDKRMLMDDKKIDWLCPEKLDEFTVGVLTGAGLPDVIAAEAGAIPAKKRFPGAAGFDYFCYLEKDRFKAAGVMKRPAARGKKKRVSCQQVRLKAWVEWKSMPKKARNLYIAKADNSEFVRRRSSAGWFERVPKLDVAEEIEVEVGPHRQEVERPSIIDEDSEAGEFVTPKKWRPAADTFADQVAAGLQKLMQTDSPAKQVARKLLTEVVTEDARMKKFVKQRVGSFNLLKKPAGRPQGSVSVTDAEIVQKLQEYSSPCPEILESSGQEIRTLHLSKRRCAKKTKLLGKSQLLKRLRLCSLGFRDGKTQRGKCDACASWERGGRRAIVKILDTIRSAITSICPLYFQTFDDEVCQDYDAYELEPCDNVEYVERLIKYVKHHHADSAAVRAPCSEEQLFEITTHEVALVDELTAWLPDLTNMSWHVSLKVTTESLWTNAWRWPLDTTAYVLWDHMVPQV